MHTEVIKQDENCIETEVLKRAGDIIKKGGLVAFPTETVYGLGGDALNPESSRKIYAAKGRPSDNPLIVHISKMQDLDLLVTEVTKQAKKLAQAFWPGPLTMVLPKSEKVPFETTGGLNTVAVRMPSHKVAREFIKEAGGYVAAPSANLSGKPSPTVARYVIEDMDGRIDMILDGGDIPIGLESTIVDLTGEVPMILRPGFITEKMLAEVLGEVASDPTMLDVNSTDRPKAPGMRYRHYAPKGKLVIVQGESSEVTEEINRRIQADKKDGFRTGVLCTRENVDSFGADVIKCMGSREKEEEIANSLYRCLREMDDENVERIYSESFPVSGIGQAIMNRLLKAAGHEKIIIGGQNK